MARPGAALAAYLRFGGPETATSDAELTHMTRRAQMSRAVSVFVAGAKSDDDALFGDLVRSGLSESEAQHALEFMPLAFARLIFERLGVKVSDEYLRVDAAGVETLRRKLADEVAYGDARAVGQYVRERDQAAFLAVAGRSAEFHAVNNALNHGSRAQDLRLSVPVFFWNGQS